MAQSKRAERRNALRMIESANGNAAREGRKPAPPIPVSIECARQFAARFLASDAGLPKAA